MLSISLEILARRGGAFVPQFHRMSEAIARFTEARQALTETPLLHAHPRLAFDAARELTRHEPT